MTEKISVIEFLLETKDDVNSPTTSTFTSKMSLCRATIAALEESLDADRSALKKMKNSTKALHASGQAHVGNEGTFATNLERLGNAALHADESDIGSAFLKFTVFSKELTSLLKNLIANINNVLTFPLEALLKGDLKGIKGDMKRPFDKSWKDYDSKVKQVEREKRQLAKEAGMIRSEITGAEIAEEMEKERRMFQLQVCEYLIKANEIKTKKGVELVQHLIDFYHAQNTFFTDGLKVIEQYRIYAEGLTANLNSLRQTQDEEHRQLVELRSMLKASVSDNDNTPTTAKNQNVYNLHQLQGNKDLGNEKSGYLLKRSEGLRRAWQKRRCVVTGGFLTMSHNNANKPPVKLNLLTSQLKLVPEDKKQFDLVSHNRTYRFMADDEGAAVVWVSVISNSKEDALNQVFGDATCGKNGSEENAGLRELTQSVISEVQRMPGNEICCDCSAPNPTWLSTNLGVLLCIECSGIHREMGVHVSRIQSITLDDLGTAELILAHSIGNENFNDIMEVKLELSMKPDPSSDMEERKSFIRGKYISRHYVTHTCGDDQDALADELKIAIHSCEISSLLQLFAEGADLLAPLPGYFQEEAALHAAVAVTGSDGSSSVVLPLVDFLAQNLGQGLNQKTSTGNTALHICAELNKTECMKLLLRSKAKTDLVNNNGDTALAIAKQNNHLACVELLEQAASGKFTPMVYVDVDWNLTFDDDEFVSDDELDDRPGPYNQNQGFGVSPHKATPENHRPRPVSFKEKPRPSIDQSAPLLPPRTNPANPPAIPPHQGALSRNRSLTVQPMSNLAEHTSRRTSTDPMPPPLPVKPALPAKTIHHAATNNLNQSPFMSAALQDQQKRNQPPDPKTAPKNLHPDDAEKTRSLPRNVLPPGGDPPEVLPRTPDPPVPLPRASVPSATRPKRVRAIYDCEADNNDELTFVENEIIIVTGVEDQDWWVGHVEHQPHRTGVFPVSFVHILTD
uniref:Zinc finger protein ArfGAP-11 n=1 Tax=Phallusia mammillata TaxID=59560 RepID=A0A6F9D639_9ASCI|nr:zinc finger protein ArfGAP-11 [Phallusia mammillata]